MTCLSTPDDQKWWRLTCVRIIDSIHFQLVPCPPDPGLCVRVQYEPAIFDLHLLLENHIKGSRESPNAWFPRSVHMAKPFLHWDTTKPQTERTGELGIGRGRQGISEVPSWEVWATTSTVLGSCSWSRQNDQVPCLPCHMFRDQGN